MEKDINNKLLIQLWKEFLVLNNFSNVEDALEEFLKCCSETINSNIDEYENMLELSNNNDEEEENYGEYPPVDSIDELLIKEVYDLEFELMKVEGKLEDAALESGDVAFVDDKDINRQLRLTNMLGSLYLTQNFYIKAIDCFSLVLKVNPSDKYDVKYKLGKAYLYSDMEEELLKLVKSYDYKKDEALLMLLVSNYITKGNIPLAHYYFECIKLINNKLVEHINASEIPVDLVEKTPKNLKNKLDRVIFAFRTIDQYILTLYHYDYMKYFANNKLPKEEFKKIDRKFNFEKEIFKKNNLETPEYIYEKCGCEHCNGGYLGRTLILESLILDDEIKEIINENCNSVRLYEYFRKNGNESLYKNGLRKIADGITSFEEVNKILFSLGEFENEL